MPGFLIRLSGEQPEDLDKFPSERGKFVGLGGAILITSGLATLSMWFALYSAVGVNPLVSVLFAALWGLAILTLDRWLVVSMPPHGYPGRWRFALPRFLMAILLGAVVSTPLVLQIFKAEIDAQVVEIKQRSAGAFTREQQSGPIGAQVTFWRAEVARHHATINSGGDTPSNPAADTKIKELTADRNAQQNEADRHYKEWQCQLYGGDGCTKKGDGVLAKASKRAYDQARARVTALNAQIEKRREQLTANDQASRGNRVEQARQELPKAQAQLDAAVQRSDDLQRRFDAENRAQGGLLIRLEALNEASAGDPTLSGARFLLFLVFLLIECLPVAVKLMHTAGRYEKYKDARDAKRARELRAELAPPMSRPAGASAGAPGGFPARDADGQTTAVRRIWGRSSEPEEPTRPPEPMHVPAPTHDTGEQRLPDDAALRNMEDNRTRAEPSGRSSGIDLYTEDDDDF
ncbi:MAG: DUF4407 domain-containing protein [Spirillospora sp.]